MTLKKYVLSSGNVIKVPVVIGSDVELEAITELLLSVMSSEEDNTHNAQVVEEIANIITGYEDRLPEVIEFKKLCKLVVGS